MTWSWIRRGLFLLLLAAIAQAITEQLRRPSDERTWEGKVAGVVPYDFRPPTPARLKEKFWAPEEAFVTPHSFGVGWSVNLGRIVYEVKKHAPGSGGAEPSSGGIDPSTDEG